MYGLRGLGRRVGGRGLGWYGLGFSYYDLLAQANLQSCDPHDVSCVASNQQKQAAVEDLWVNNYESNPATAGAPAPAITVTANTSPGAIAAFEQNAPATEALTTVDNRTFTTPQLESGPVIVSQPDVPRAPAPSAPPPAGSPSPKPPGAGPQAQGAPGLSPTLTLPGSAGGFSFSSIPWWGWAAGAAVALFAFRGKR